MQPIIEVIELSHSFGGLKALTDFSLEIFPGELVGLIGPNGAGKTTVFNLITGVFPISAGRIRFRGEDISDWRSHRITAAGIARTFQNIRLFKELSVLDNVRLGAFGQHRYSLLDALRRSRRFSAAEQEVTRQAFELLERFNLTHYAHTPARHLAYGIYVLSRLMAKDPGLWDTVQETMNILMDPVMGLIHELFSRYEEPPFGEDESTFTTFAMGQFQKRLSRIERARGMSMKEVDAMTTEIIDADDA